MKSFIDTEPAKACVYMNGVIDLEATILAANHLDIVKDIFVMLEYLEHLQCRLRKLEQSVFEANRRLQFAMDKKCAYENGKTEHVDVEWYGTYEEVCKSVVAHTKELHEKRVPVNHLKDIYNAKSSELLEILNIHNATIEPVFDMCDKNTYKLYFNRK